MAAVATQATPVSPVTVSLRGELTIPDASCHFPQFDRGNLAVIDDFWQLTRRSNCRTRNWDAPFWVRTLRARHDNGDLRACKKTSCQLEPRERAGDDKLVDPTDSDAKRAGRPSASETYDGIYARSEKSYVSLARRPLSGLWARHARQTRPLPVLPSVAQSGTTTEWRSRPRLLRTRGDRFRD